MGYDSIKRNKIGKMKTFQLLLSGDKDLIAKKIKYSQRTNMPLAT
jgi:hypothetical protein